MSPAQKAAWDRLVEAKKAFDEVDNAIADHEEFNRKLLSRRLPPGVRMPPVTPVPQAWLQQRAAALSRWQQATDAYKATR